MNKQIKISKKGEDGYKYVSLRIKENLLSKVEKLASQTNCSRNEVINIIIESSIDCVIIE